LQSIGLSEKAQEAEAHVVAEQIHHHILKKFTSGLEPSNNGHEQQTANEAEEEAMEDEVVQDIWSSTDGNKGDTATSSRTSLSTLSQRFRQGREHQAGVGSGNITTTDDPQHPHCLPPTVNGGESHGTSSCLRSLTMD